MKRYIKASYNKIDTYNFKNALKSELRKVLPHRDNYVSDGDDPRYPELTIENPPELNELIQCVKRAISNIGYDPIDVSSSTDYTLAAVAGEAFVYLTIDVGDYFNNGLLGYVSIDGDTGNVIFEDWYDDANRTIL